MKTLFLDAAAGAANVAAAAAAAFAAASDAPTAKVAVRETCATKVVGVPPYWHFGGRALTITKFFGK